MSIPTAQSIKGYELLDLIGEGAYGAVYRAHQPVVDREVAVKIILPEYANRPDFIRRFESEAQLVAQLEHLHIVPLYDYWRDPGGAYLVMRLMKGKNLEDALRENGAWKPEQAARLVDQTASALEAAHQQGVVHRDLKPANILLDEEGNAYLSDFGIAKELGSDRGATATGAILGTPAYITPEQIQSQSVTPQTDIYALGILLYELLVGGHPFPDTSTGELVAKHLSEPLPYVRDTHPELPAAVDGVIQRATAKNPAERYSTALALAEDFRRALQLEVELPLVPEEEIYNPYKGLRAFQEADCDDFFGREALTGQLLAHLAAPGREGRFLAVVGPSGSGKSSVVKAGLVPALRQGALPSSGEWYIVETHPGSQPMKEMELALLSISADPDVNLSEILERDEYGLLNATRKILTEGASELLLVIDQFEELFILMEDEAEYSHYLEKLYIAVTEPTSRLRVVITLRADFYDRPLLHPEFGRLVEERTAVVLPLSLEELEQAIRKPAERAGAVLEKGLVSTITSDVANQPGALPLMQYALTELFERREGRMLTCQMYQEIDGVLGALGRRAEEVYGELEQESKDATRQLFLRLVTLGEGAEDTRRRVLRSEVETLHAPSLHMVIESFGHARLLSFDRDPITRGPTVEVAHEALLSEWRRLREWLDESRADIRMQRVLDNAAADWQAANKDASFLLRGSRLDQFEAWADTTDMALTQLEGDFLDTSLAERRARQAVEAERMVRQTATERRSRNFLRALVVVFALAAIVAAGLSIYAFNQRAIAVEQTQLTQARELAYASANTLGEDPERSLLLALEAVKTKDIIESTNALHQALPELSVLKTIPMEGMLDGIDFNSNGTKLAISGFENLVRIWDVGQDQIISELHFPIEVVGAEVDFSPDDSLVAAGGLTGQADLTVWDAETGDVLHSWVSQPDAPLTFVGTSGEVVFSPDGSRVAVANLDGTPHVFDVLSGEAVFKLEGHSTVAGGLAYSPDGAYIATGDNGLGEVILWDANTGEQEFILEGKTQGIYSVAFSPDGGKITAVGDDAILHVWDTFTGKKLLSPESETAGYRAVIFSHDGQHIYTGGQDSTVRVWDAANGDNLKTLAGHGGVVISLALSPDGKFLASGGADMNLKYWDLSPGKELFTVPFIYPTGGGIALTPDGSTLVANGSTDTIKRYDPVTGEQLDIFTQVELEEGDQLGRLVFTPDGNSLIALVSNGDVLVFDYETKDQVMTLRGHAGPLTGGDITTDGRYLVTSGFDNKAIVWDLKTGNLVTAYDKHTYWVLDAIFSLDDEQVYSASADGTVHVWDLHSGETLKMVPAVGGLGTIEITPDGKSIVGATIDGFVTIWDAETWEEIEVFLAHTGGSWDSAVTADGSRLVTAGFEGSAKVWELPGWEPVATLYGHQGNVTEVEISPDGKIVYSGSWDGLMRGFLLEVDKLVELAESRLTRSFTEEECQTYLHLDRCPEE